jgi:hypothetical protein
VTEKLSAKRGLSIAKQIKRVQNKTKAKWELKVVWRQRK